MAFLDRVAALPRLGIGVSTEYGAFDAPGGLDVAALRAEAPGWAAFLEAGVEVARGLDAPTRRWVAAGLPTTYHFLDVNLDEPEDLDPAWLDGLRALVAGLRPAWLCGDAGLWHFGPRDRGHMLLLPPVLTAEGADRLADGVAALRSATGLEVLPENPPGTAWLGDLHLLDFLARLAERADTGLLLDVAHLAIYQAATGRSPLDGLDGFPAERVVEVHVAGGRPATTDGWPWLEDTHSPEPVPATWAILDALAPRLVNLRAVVFECERNPLAAVRPGFAAIERALAAVPGWR